MELAPVVLENYNPRWKKDFSEMKAEIFSVLSNVNIEHIGSTAINNMPAKPEIDILIGVENINEEKSIQKLESLGFVYFKKFEAQVPERRYLRKSNGDIPLFHIHMVEKTSDFYKNHIKFRNILNADPKLKEEYASLKIALAKKFKDDRVMYQNEKESFILGVIK